MTRSIESRPSFAQLTRRYLSTLNEYRDAKSAGTVAGRIGQSTQELEHHAAQLHARHQDAFAAVVHVAMRMHAAGIV